MSNRIEQVISDIEEYIDGCKLQAFSSTKIVVEKPQLEEYLEELRQYTPEEVKKYQRMLSNRDKILSDAKKKAQEVEEKAMAYADHLVAENQITRMAYEKADEIINQAKEEAKQILDSANSDAETIRTGALTYTNDMLENVQSIISSAIEDSQSKYSALISSLAEHQNTVSRNLRELNQTEEEAEIGPNAQANPQQFFESDPAEDDSDETDA